MDLWCLPIGSPVTSDLLYALYVITSLGMVVSSWLFELYDNKSSNIQTAVSTSTFTKCTSCGNEKIITDTESGEKSWIFVRYSTQKVG